MTPPANPPGHPSPLGEGGFVRVPPDSVDGLLNELTPNGTHRMALILSKIYELLREETDVAKDAMAAQAAKDRARATAWEALAAVLRSKMAIPAMTIAVASVAIGGLELVGVDIDKLPALITAWKCS